MLSVLTTTEGTYPYSAGGVSTWCDALLRNASGELDLGSPYSALLGFHRLYSRILLASARSRLSG